MKKALTWSRCISDKMPAALWEGDFLPEHRLGEDNKAEMEELSQKTAPGEGFFPCSWHSLFGFASHHQGLLLVVFASHFWAGQQWFVLISGNLFTRFCFCDLKTSLGSPLNEVHSLALGNFRSFLQLIRAQKINQLKATDRCSSVATESRNVTRLNEMMCLYQWRVVFSNLYPLIFYFKITQIIVCLLIGNTLINTVNFV